MALVWLIAIRGPLPLSSPHPQACRAVIDNHAFQVFLTDKLQRILEEFGAFDDPHERLSAVIERAKRIPALPPAARTDANRVRGCVSVVWLAAETREGRGYFHGDAESPLVRGLVVFVTEFFSGAPLEELAVSEIEPLDALDLTRNLSPTRRNGLAAARKAIRDFARAARPSS
jgi:cysteine desulfuration protein SufE